MGIRGGPECSGSIPACAGEPGVGVGSGFPSGVYPRVCGGTNPPGFGIRTGRGLSPRVRGNPLLMAASIIVLRSIPACAGEPGVNGEGRRRRRVYPRVCGGTIGLTGFINDPNGSIPACAGEPLANPGTNIDLEVYPRVCGGTS